MKIRRIKKSANKFYFFSLSHKLLNVKNSVLLNLKLLSLPRNSERCRRCGFSLVYRSFEVREISKKIFANKLHSTTVVLRHRKLIDLEMFCVKLINNKKYFFVLQTIFSFIIVRRRWRTFCLGFSIKFMIIRHRHPRRRRQRLGSVIHLSILFTAIKQIDMGLRCFKQILVFIFINKKIYIRVKR